MCEDETHKHNTKSKRPETKEYMIPNFVYAKFKTQRSSMVLEVRRVISIVTSRVSRSLAADDIF